MVREWMRFLSNKILRCHYLLLVCKLTQLIIGNLHVVCIYTHMSTGFTCKLSSPQYTKDMSALHLHGFDVGNNNMVEQ